MLGRAAEDPGVAAEYRLRYSGDPLAELTAKIAAQMHADLVVCRRVSSTSATGSSGSLASRLVRARESRRCTLVP